MARSKSTHRYVTMCVPDRNNALYYVYDKRQLRSEQCASRAAADALAAERNREASMFAVDDCDPRAR